MPSFDRIHAASRRRRFAIRIHLAVILVALGPAVVAASPAVVDPGVAPPRPAVVDPGPAAVDPGAAVTSPAGSNDRASATSDGTASATVDGAKAPVSEVAVAPTPGPQRLGFLVGAGYLGSPGYHGGVLVLGLRYRLLKYFALGFDIGYGVVAAETTVQDRWWIMPSAALVIPAGPVTLDVGAGLGLGATSGYTNWPDYVAAPFGPIWAYQLVPSVRGHVMAAMKLSRKLDLFARFDVASLVLAGSTIGSRVGNPNPVLADTIWYNLIIGVSFRLL